MPDHRPARSRPSLHASNCARVAGPLPGSLLTTSVLETVEWLHDQGWIRLPAATARTRAASLTRHFFDSTVAVALREQSNERCLSSVTRTSGLGTRRAQGVKPQDRPTRTCELASGSPLSDPPAKGFPEPRKRALLSSDLTESLLVIGPASPTIHPHSAPTAAQHKGDPLGQD